MKHIKQLFESSQNGINSLKSETLLVHETLVKYCQENDVKSQIITDDIRYDLSQQGYYHNNYKEIYSLTDPQLNDIYDIVTSIYGKHVLKTMLEHRLKGKYRKNTI